MCFFFFFPPEKTRCLRHSVTYRWHFLGNHNPEPHSDIGPLGHCARFCINDCESLSMLLNHELLSQPGSASKILCHLPKFWSQDCFTRFCPLCWIKAGTLISVIVVVCNFFILSIKRVYYWGLCSIPHKSLDGTLCLGCSNLVFPHLHFYDASLKKTFCLAVIINLSCFETTLWSLGLQLLVVYVSHITSQVFNFLNYLCTGCCSNRLVNALSAVSQTV